jgi:hypothetical protein
MKKNVSGLDVERPVRTVEPKNRTEYKENEVLPPVTATLSHNKQVKHYISTGDAMD